MKTLLYTNKNKRKPIQDTNTWNGRDSLWGNTNNAYKIHPSDFDWIAIGDDASWALQAKEMPTELILDPINIIGHKSTGILKNTTSTQSLWHESKYLGSLNSSFSVLIKEINDSKYILSQKIDSEIENSPVYSLESWLRGIKFIIKYANHVFFKEKQRILTPKIYHGPENSIDIYWDYSHLNMLLNVPMQGEGSFSLDDNGYNKINGFFNPDEPTFKYLPLAF